MNCNCAQQIKSTPAREVSLSFSGLADSGSFKYVLEELANGSPNPKERRRLVREVREAIKACADAERKYSAESLSGIAWTLLSDSLPDPYEEVRILFDGVPRIARLGHRGEYFQLCTFAESIKGQYVAPFDRVSGWMPLPYSPVDIGAKAAS